MTTTIASRAELDRVLGEDYVVLAGSAISGAAPPCLPMVEKVTRGLIDCIAHTRHTAYVEALAAAYAAQLVRGRESYRNLLSETKFEEFLGLLQEHSSEPARHDLLEALYSCQRGDEGPNHLAIDELLRTGRCRAVLTTNFDNALELASPSTKVLVYPKDKSALARPLPVPVIVKLHGDAKQRNCVAIARSLTEDARLASQAFLSTHLADARVLVLGYSGFGDIDIAPHLESAAKTASAVFVWGCRDPAKVPSWAQYAFRTDLSRVNPRENVLIDLVGCSVASASRCTRDDLKLKGDLEKWLQTADLDALGLIESLFAWRTAAPGLHLLHARRIAPGAELYRRMAAGCVEAGAYWSALRYSRRGSRVTVSTAKDRTELRWAQGFSWWRLGFLARARAILSSALDSALRSGEWSRAASVCRVYLEACRDGLRARSPGQKRQEAFVAWNVDRMVKILDSLTSHVASDDLLARVVKADLQRLMGTPISDSVFISLSEEANATKRYGAEWAATVPLAMMSRSGIGRLEELRDRFAKSGMPHYVRKCQLSIAEAACAERISTWSRLQWLAVRIWFQDGKWGAPLKVAPREVQYLLARRRWRRWERGWRVGQPVPTIGPDFDY